VENKNIKTQAEVEAWLKDQVVIQGIDPVRVRVAAEIRPDFDHEVRPEDFPGGLHERAEAWCLDGAFWFETLSVSVFVEGVLLGQQSLTVTAGRVPVGGANGDEHKSFLSYEDRLSEWQQLAISAVTHAAVRLGTLRGVVLSWGVAIDEDHSQNTPPMRTSGTLSLES
jgi:hypothetical protein